MNNYVTLPNGVIKQKQICQKLCTYGLDYSSKYDSYGQAGELLSHVRLGFLLGAIRRTPSSLLDVGYGNGSFLKACSKCIGSLSGTDISGYPLPEGISTVPFEQALNTKYDVVTFFDSLEHFEDISFIARLQCNYVFITLPWCHNTSDEWFLAWKHRRPDEHLWHFSKDALIAFFKENGYEVVNCGVPFEDMIRKDTRYTPNILTGVFKKVVQTEQSAPEQPENSPGDST